MIDSTEHIDLDLSVPPPGQATGLLAMPPSEFDLMCDGMMSLEEARPGMMVAPSQFYERSQRLCKLYRDDTKKIYQQGRLGSCTGMMIGQLLETLFNRRYGQRHWVGLSGLSGYKQIPGVGPTSGATIQQAMEVGCLKGLLPENTPENRARFAHTHSIADWNERLAPGFSETAMMFRGVRFVKARGLDMICSGLINGLPGGVGRDQHAVPYTYLDYYKNEPVAAGPNSWGSDFGDRGFLYDSKRTFENLTVFFLLDVVVRPDIPIPNLDDDSG